MMRRVRDDVGQASTEYLGIVAFVVAFLLLWIIIGSHYRLLILLALVPLVGTVLTAASIAVIKSRYREQRIAAIRAVKRRAGQLDDADHPEGRSD